MSELLRALKKAKVEGCAWDLGEEIADIRCVAAPIFSHSRSPVAAIWMTGPASRITEARLRQLSPLVLGEANAISLHLGCPADHLVIPKNSGSPER